MVNGVSASIVVLALVLVCPAVASNLDDRFQHAMLAYERGYLPETALLLQDLAQQGHADSQARLGAIFFAGKGLPRDESKAAYWYRQAAEQGHAQAQLDLGILYTWGQGVPLDKVKAAEWLRKSAQQGVAKAQRLLGAIYALGDGIPLDYVEGYTWLHLAAVQSWEGAQQIRDTIARKMTPTQLAEAKERSRRYIEQYVVPFKSPR